MYRLSIAAVSAFLLFSCNGVDRDAVMRYAENEEYGDLAEYCMAQGDRIRFIDLCEANMALARMGRLGKDAFSLHQAGLDGLIPEWDQTARSGEWLSDIYFAMGHVAMAQRMAFEAYVSSDGFNARMVRRLVETNIIYGAYPVAEKYISALERDGKYRKWASAQRPFLGNDAAVEADPLYGPLRRCIPDQDFISAIRGIDEDLKDIIRANPSFKPAMDYLGLYYLLNFDFISFRGMLDGFYGTAALEELPPVFAQAVCMMSEEEAGYWKRMGVSSEMYREYQRFKSRYAAGLDISMYSDTFWEYMRRTMENEGI